MKHVSDFPRAVVEHADMGIIMSDGCRLSARVWMPDDAEQDPVPVILEHIPYRKRDGTIVRDQFTHPWFAGHGYACIRTDIRGSGESEGLLKDEYLQQELLDACEVIAWAAEQPWCNGNVGMMGISWGGFNGLQTAFLQPPALKAVISLCSTADRYADDIHYKGGCMLVENFGWAATMLSYSSRPPDPALVGEKWKQMWLDRLQHQSFHWSRWTRHQHRDAYWKHGSVCEDYSRIKAAVLSIGGWHDGYHNTVSRLVENLEAPVKGIVGPWNHKYPHYAGPEPAIGFLQEAKRWWDHWLKGEDTGVEDDPAYRVYLMDSLAPRRWFEERPGRWIAETQWPSPDVLPKILYLGQGCLHEAASDPFTVDVCTPQDCGRQAGEYFPFAFGDELPDEQTPDDVVSACFDSEILQQAMDIVGAPEIQLTVRADRPNAQIAVRLCDLRPDGTSALITWGLLNLTHRTSHEFPAAIEPGESFDISLALDQIAYHLPDGHRLRIAVSTTYWPVIWPSAEVTTVSIMAGRLILPLRPPSTGNETGFEKPEAAPAWKQEQTRPPDYSRTTFFDDATGRTVTEIFCDFGENRDLEHGLMSGSWVNEHFSVRPDDPLSARARAEWQQTGGREGQMWRTVATAEMWADASCFYATARLQAFDNEDQPVFEKTFNDKVRRELV